MAHKFRRVLSWKKIITIKVLPYPPPPQDSLWPGGRVQVPRPIRQPPGLRDLVAGGPAQAGRAQLSQGLPGSRAGKGKKIIYAESLVSVTCFF